MNQLRKALIRLAHNEPSTRDEILPMLTPASPSWTTTEGIKHRPGNLPGFRNTEGGLTLIQFKRWRRSRFDGDDGKMETEWQAVEGAGAPGAITIAKGSTIKSVCLKLRKLGRT